MVLAPETRQRLCESFLRKLCLSPDKHLLAHRSLGKVKRGLAVLLLIEEPSVQDQIAFSTSIDFMNHLHPNWAPSFGPISDAGSHILFLCAESDSILMVKDEEERAIYQPKDMLLLLEILFEAFKFPYSKENRYIMKSMLWILCVSENSSEVFVHSISHLISILETICNRHDARDPIVNRYIFESIAVIVKRASQIHMDPKFLTDLERIIISERGKLNNGPVTDLLAYTYEITAQCIEWNTPSHVWRREKDLFDKVSSPVLWYKPQLFPALLRLLQAFIHTVPRDFGVPREFSLQRGRLYHVVGIFNMLISSPCHDELGFYLLNNLIQSLEYLDIAGCIPHVWNVLFMRLEENRAVKFVNSLMISMSLFLVKHGSKKFVQSLDVVMPWRYSFCPMLEQVWIPNLKMFTGATEEVKLAAVASTMLLCQCHNYLDDPAMALNLGVKLLDTIITLLWQPEEDRVDKEKREILNIPKNMDCILYYAGKKREDLLKSIIDPKVFLLTTLVKFPASVVVAHKIKQ